MIVFTITNTTTGKVYVASTRNAPEERWAQLLTQAEDGVEGSLFDDIREYGDTAFCVEEWGFGEDPSEIRQLMREAQEDLGAEPLNTGKTELASVAKRKKLSDREAARLLEDLERNSYQTPDVPGDKGDAEYASSKLQQLKAQASPKPAKEDTAPLAMAAGRVASRAHEQRIRDAIEAERLRREEEKRAQIRRESADINRVIASIELRRQAQRNNAAVARKARQAKAKLPPGAPADIKHGTPERTIAVNKPAVQRHTELPGVHAGTSVSVKHTPEPRALVSSAHAGTGAKTVKSTALTPKALPEGRVSSSTKEKQIRAAIEEERALRLAEKQIQAAREASEMANLMARIDARAKDADKQRRRR